MRVILNIGRDINNRMTNTSNLDNLSLRRVVVELDVAGFEIEAIETKDSKTESTFVVLASFPDEGDKILPEVVHNLSVALKQEAIAFLVGGNKTLGEGKLVGTFAWDWGSFNPEFFLMPTVKY